MAQVGRRGSLRSYVILRFESVPPHQYGSVVKWLRHCPFTAVTRVQTSPESPFHYFPARGRRASCEVETGSSPSTSRFDSCQSKVVKPHISIMRSGLEMVPAQPHKLCNAGSSPVSARSAMMIPPRGALWVALNSSNVCRTSISD